MNRSRFVDDEAACDDETEEEDDDDDDEEKEEKYTYESSEGSEEVSTLLHAATGVYHFITGRTNKRGRTTGFSGTCARRVVG